MDNKDRTLVISDIHGHTDCLRLLLDIADYKPERDRLLLLGDYVNKGPDSEGTLRLVRKLVQAGAVALKGNNEGKLLRKYEDTPFEVPWLTEELAQFMRSLPLWAEDDEYVYVHAGIRPGIPLRSQTEADLTQIRNVFYASPLRWGKTVVFGHTSTTEMGARQGYVWASHADKRIAIDTGAGHLVRLSLVDLTNRRVYACEIGSMVVEYYRLGASGEPLPEKFQK